MASFANSSFDIRIKKVRQLYTAYSLRGMFTRAIMSKFANSDYVFLEGQYKSGIIKLVGETDIDVLVKNNTYLSIPVRTPIPAIDRILREVYSLQNSTEDLSTPILEKEPELVEEVPVEEVVETEQIDDETEIVEETAQEELPVEEDTTEEVIEETPVEVAPVQPRTQTTNVPQNNNYHNPRNNNYQQNKK